MDNRKATMQASRALVSDDQISARMTALWEIMDDPQTKNEAWITAQAEWANLDDELIYRTYGPTASTPSR